MIVGIVGIGLIGGSMAKAYKEDGHTVYVYDIDKSIVEFAKLSGVIDDSLTKDNISACDIVILALTPKNTINYLKENSIYFKKEQLVIDCCGTKKEVCREGFRLSQKYGYTFVGGHPMAGRQFSGFKNSRADLFKDATMAIVPPKYDDIELFDKIKTALLPAKFGRYTIWTSENHDEIIAFTSQLAHIVSNAYMKSPTARQHKGLSAGSYKDLTRVAYLNAPMWTELFMENKENVLRELDTIISSMTQYKNALENDDAKALCSLLEEGSKIKEEVDNIAKGRS